MRATVFFIHKTEQLTPMKQRPQQEESDQENHNGSKRRLQVKRNYVHSSNANKKEHVAKTKTKLTIKNTSSLTVHDSLKSLLDRQEIIDDAQLSISCLHLLQSGQVCEELK